MNKNLTKIKNKGSLLLELLIVIALLGVILGVGAQAVYVSLQSGKISGERDVAMGLASEELEAVRGIAEENWQGVYNLTKTPQQYHPVQSGTKWATSTASEIIALNNASYTRYFTVDNVSRDPTTRLIEPTYNSADDDPSTQKVTVTVSWTGADPVTIIEYLLRWKNKACDQTDWSGGAVTGVKTCPDNTYDSISPAGTINTTVGAIKLQ